MARAAIEGRRTVKEGYVPEPVPRADLERILAAARWAPNHRLTEPWRFRVVGPSALERLRVAAGAGADKLCRAPTLVVATCAPSPVPLHAAEDVQATAAAIYAALLAAHELGYASYWRTPGVLRTPEGREAVGVGDDEVVLGLLHFGRVEGQLPEPPARRGVEEYVTWLD